MSISKGGQSVKPYVGSKEVQEAYVGSQLVYRATPPYVYAFLGTQNSYMLADWCTLSSSGAAIVKEGNNFRIALSGVYFPAVDKFQYGSININMPANAGSTLSFMYKMGGSGGYPQVYARFFNKDSSHNMCNFKISADSFA